MYVYGYINPGIFSYSVATKLWILCKFYLARLCFAQLESWNQLVALLCTRNIEAFSFTFASKKKGSVGWGIYGWINEV